MGPIFERINTMLEHFTIKLLPKLREVQAKGEIMVVVVEKGKNMEKISQLMIQCIFEPIIKTIRFIMNLIHKS
jgi:response regulator of citrate/malate metabolism